MVESRTLAKVNRKKNRGRKYEEKEVMVIKTPDMVSVRSDLLYSN